MSDQYIEKSFLYLVTISLFIHVAVFVLIVIMPGKRQDVVIHEPYMVELEDLPNQPTLPKASKEKEVRRKSINRSRVNKEIAPKGEMPKEKISSSRNISRKLPQATAESQNKMIERALTGEIGKEQVRKVAPGGDLFVKKKPSLPELARLYPNAAGLEKLEKSYRRKYESEVEEGETKFLNTDDIQFGSFLRRFETAVYGVWRYPADAARLGVEGVTPVKITFNKKGEIENVQLLETSGSKILDNEVFRTLRLIGPMGSFPKGYERDKFNLIAFFQYGIIRGVNRGMLH